MIEGSRRVEELESVTDCVEEILYAVRQAHAFAFVATAIELGKSGVDLYDRVEEIVMRAQELSLQASSDSQLQIE